MTEEDRGFIQQAIAAAKECVSEPGRESPKVGAVVVKDGKVLGVAHRGQLETGEYAEFTVLDKLLKNEIVAGTTVYTTLEPCTTRNHPKVPCAQRLIDRKVARVVIGMLDPNEKICGKGVLKLRDANIETVMFPPDLMAQVEDQNREFRRFVLDADQKKAVSEDFISRYSARDLDEWYKALNYIYADRNFYRDALSIFAHLTEVIGGLSLLASEKRKQGKAPEDFMPKAFAWWLALNGKLGVVSVSDLLWLKFPGVCPYCQQESDHDAGYCQRMKRGNPTPPWARLREVGKKRKKPKSLGEWQRMFRQIYKPGPKADFQTGFARLTEELGELAEAIRVFPAEPSYFLSEAADVFAWLMNVQNNIDFKAERDLSDYGKDLERAMCLAYPAQCLDCGKDRCVCPPILESTIGRIAHEVPPESGLFDPGAMFMRPDKARSVFSVPG
jgi:pyrimidine deaminase RibD-like protein/NTP pyrophosphatase (non-canonical NTP hydrolase)